MFFIIKVLILLIGTASKSNFWQFSLIALYQEIQLILRSNNLVFVIEVLILFINRVRFEIYVFFWNILIALYKEI